MKSAHATHEVIHWIIFCGSFKMAADENTCIPRSNVLNELLADENTFIPRARSVLDELLAVIVGVYDKGAAGRLDGEAVGLLHAAPASLVHGVSYE